MFVSKADLLPLKLTQLGLQRTKLSTLEKVLSNEIHTKMCLVYVRMLSLNQLISCETIGIENQGVLKYFNNTSLLIYGKVFGVAAIIIFLVAVSFLTDYCKISHTR